MPLPKKDGAGGSAPGKGDNRQNGNRSSFRTDAAISNSRFNERVLQPWVPDSTDGINGALEKSSGGQWDQFAENERLFGLKTDYDENIYTTQIDTNHPQYRQRIAAAERKAREIERSAPTTAHVAEERVMDFSGGGDDEGQNEEDKYSGVRRQDFPPLSNRENKYTPPAKRAPTGQSTVKGAPIDPAIISSQIKAPAKKQPSPAPQEPKLQVPDSTKNGVLSQTEPLKKSDSQKSAVAAGGKATEEAVTELNPAAQPSNGKTPEVKPAEKTSTPLRSSGTSTRNMSPQVNEGTPSATSTVERDVLKEFKTFASQQRLNAEKVRSSKAKADKEVKLTELKKFADSFKLSTPVPTDLVSIIAKDPSKQKEIQAKAIKNAEEVAKAKAEAAKKEKSTPTKDSQSKAPDQTTPATAPVPGSSTDPRSSRTPATTQATPPAAGQNRHPGGRQQYPQQQYHGQQYRNNRGGPQHIPPQQQTGGLAQRLRSVEQQKFGQGAPAHQPHLGGQEMRAPPTGPANSVEPGYNRRLSGVPHMGPKLNPSITEFKPSASAVPFNPSGPSAGSSPRSSVNPAVDATVAAPAPSGQLIRRKTKAIDVKKCYILSHIKTFAPTQGRNWDENDGLRPSYDTLPTWKQLQDNEKPDSTMHLNYKEYFERQPFGGPALATPNPPHVVPQMPHQHQLPFHLQHGAHNMGPRQSPHMTPMQMHTPQHGPPHPPYGNEEHTRMVHSNSAQSFSSPRPGNVPMAYGMNSPAQMPYNQPVFMGPGTPQMGQYRSFSQNPQQFMSPQQTQMGGPMMMPQQQFVPGPQGMMPAPQMMYPGGHPQFMPSAPQPVPGANGYPSPGRPAAPMMMHQGSQQGQPMYGMSPNVQYSQPVFTPGQPNGPMTNMRGGYGSPGPQHFGTSPSQGHQYGPQHRNNGNNYNKGYSAHSQHQTPQSNHAVPAMNQGRTNEGPDEAK
ncbi:Fc.00g017190.m01.CDS01 [Cosmosporella sp. VM-42]